MDFLEFPARPPLSNHELLVEVYFSNFEPDFEGTGTLLVL
jgi:hypothetical protein